MGKTIRSKSILIILGFIYGIYFFLMAFISVPAKVFATKRNYSGVLYISGMGGHFAMIDMDIDPNDLENPLKINNLDRIVIGDKNTHPTHDPRIDVEDRNLLFWSTFALDPGGRVHIGKTNLKTGEVLKDIALLIDSRTKGPSPIYCGSGQTRNSYIPITMATEAYLDIFDKKELKHKHRIFLNELGYKPGSYQFFHGTNTPDMKGFLLAINLTTLGVPNGKIDILILDLYALENGKVKLLSKNTISGRPIKTISFRQSFTKDDKYILQSGKDRMFIIDGKSLNVQDEVLVKGENHDAMATPDGKYIILTLRDGNDGKIQLYDTEKKRLLGSPVSVCNACHGKIGVPNNNGLCGIDGNWK